jgi:hypothetical protein
VDMRISVPEGAIFSDPLEAHAEGPRPHPREATAVVLSWS